MTAEQVQKFFEMQEKQLDMMEALIKASQKQCEFLKNIQDVLVCIGMQLTSETSQNTLADNVDTLTDTVAEIKDQVDEIAKSTEELAGAFDPQQKNNFADLVCDVAGDVEKLREALADGTVEIVSPQGG